MKINRIIGVMVFVLVAIGGVAESLGIGNDVAIIKCIRWFDMCGNTIHAHGGGISGKLDEDDFEDSDSIRLSVGFNDGKATLLERGVSCADEYEGRSRFEAADGTFLLKGKPYHVIAAELHYPRIPKEYWEHRIKMCKALGMNTICLYVFWNFHEPKEGELDFTGQKDLRHFIQLCHKQDMKVILRPGPYVCAEWEMGGLPWWLLKKKDIRLRENDPYFLERVEKFLKAVAGQVGDLTIKDGGPIIMVQVENEYGSYGVDKLYVSNIRDMVRKNFGDDVALFQCDWSSNFEANGLDDVVWTLNFGAGANVDDQFRRLKELRPDSPLMCSEFWSGWFDKWGANHETRSADDMIAGMDEMLGRNISLSLYMAHGGTNWGHWAGANSPGFAPDVTSYDYDAPINEQGAPTGKYWKLRKMMEKYTDGRQAPVPDPIEITAILEFKFTEVAPLFANLPEPKKDRCIKTMEQYDQGFGSILYSTKTPATCGQTLLTVNDPHDYAQIFLDGLFVGKLDRRNGEKQLVLPPLQEGQRLDILVEAMGRINFGRAIKDFKGITGNVTITENRNGKDNVCDLKDWEVYNLPDEYELYENMRFETLSDVTNAGKKVPGVYRATFYVEEPGDTYLNFETFGKGLVYVNGIGIGRIWEIGPQQTLYMPGVWLKKGENEILVFDIIGSREAKCRGERVPIIDRLRIEEPLVHREEGQNLDLTGEEPVVVSSFDGGNGWKEVSLSIPVRGRYICLEAANAIDGGNVAAIAELHLLDENGERLSREAWTVNYADSEDVKGVNRAGDKVFDLQESTFWSTTDAASFPHYLVIDLGAVHTISGLQCLPRMEADAPGAIKDFKLYVKEEPFSV